MNDDSTPDPRERMEEIREQRPRIGPDLTPVDNDPLDIGAPTSDACDEPLCTRDADYCAEHGDVVERTRIKLPRLEPEIYETLAEGLPDGWVVEHDQTNDEWYIAEAPA
jgi:hypothetical protein